MPVNGSESLFGQSLIDLIFSAAFDIFSCIHLVPFKLISDEYVLQQISSDCAPCSSCLVRKHRVEISVDQLQRHML